MEIFATFQEVGIEIQCCIAQKMYSKALLSYATSTIGLEAELKYLEQYIYKGYLRIERDSYLMVFTPCSYSGRISRSSSSSECKSHSHCKMAWRLFHSSRKVVAKRETLLNYSSNFFQDTWIKSRRWQTFFKKFLTSEKCRIFKSFHKTEESAVKQ